MLTYCTSYVLLVRLACRGGTGCARASSIGVKSNSHPNLISIHPGRVFPRWKKDFLGRMGVRFRCGENAFVVGTSCRIPIVGKSVNGLRPRVKRCVCVDHRGIFVRYRETWRSNGSDGEKRNSRVGEFWSVSCKRTGNGRGGWLARPSRGEG